jgi:hypothetical protein
LIEIKQRKLYTLDVSSIFNHRVDIMDTFFIVINIILSSLLIIALERITSLYAIMSKTYAELMIHDTKSFVESLKDRNAHNK